MHIGAEASKTFTVTAADTASAVGSGSLPVLGTPVLLAWCEAVACAAVADALDARATTVGTDMQIRHRRPSRLGAEVTVVARLTSADGLRLEFDTEARDSAGQLLGTVRLGRAVVDAATFLQ